ncbi:MAG: PAS domain S-box protein [Candidatus Nealsonbacteria bacterium]|nr:PAS domain S-box protein [Candidatus Nealsonbacteria bacterium]
MTEENNLLKKNLERIKEDLDDLQRYVDDLTMFLPLAFCTVNPLNLILGVNQSFQTLTGYDEMESIGNSIDFLFLEKSKVQELKEEMPVQKDSIQKEFVLLKKNNEKVPVSVSTLARRDNNDNFLGYFLVITDISETKEFQKKLEERVSEKTKELEIKNVEVTESRLALLNILEDVEDAWKKAEEEKNKTMAIITNFTDGLMVFDRDNVVRLINPKIEKFFYISSEEVINKSLNELKDSKNMLPLIESLSESSLFQNGNGSTDQFRAELVNKDNLTLDISEVSIINEDEKIGSLVVVHDITREKMIEAMKSEFVSIAAHQLRTPLSAIKWTMRILLDGDLGELNEDQKGLVEKTYSSNERMISLINDLLNVTRIEEGRYLYQLELSHIEDIAVPLIESYKTEIKRRGIKFNINIPKKKTPKIATDVGKITLVIQNFIENAMKYTNQGGVMELNISYNKEKDEIEVSVKDSGVGIPKDQHGRVFTKFFRAKNIIKMETEGSGLGLFICKNIVEAHKGRVWFESEEGVGSTFYFSLPVRSQEEFDDFLKKL